MRWYIGADHARPLEAWDTTTGMHCVHQVHVVDKLTLLQSIDALVNKVWVSDKRSPPPSGGTMAQFLRQSFGEGKVLIRCHKLEYLARSEAMRKILLERAPRTPAADPRGQKEQYTTRETDARLFKKPRRDY